jgi:hypothetical protein
MWTILPSSVTLIGGILIYILRRRCWPKSDKNSRSIYQGSLRVLARACGQMVALHLFDRLARIYLRTNPKRTETAKQIETLLIQRLGLKVSQHSRKQLTLPKED